MFKILNGSDFWFIACRRTSGSSFEFTYFLCFRNYRKDSHYSTKKVVKSGGRIVESVRNWWLCRIVIVLIRQFKCLDYWNPDFFKTQIFSICAKKCLCSRWVNVFYKLIWWNRMLCNMLFVYMYSLILRINVHKLRLTHK